MTRSMNFRMTYLNKLGLKEYLSEGIVHSITCGYSLAEQKVDMSTFCPFLPLQKFE